MTPNERKTAIKRFGSEFVAFVEDYERNANFTVAKLGTEWAIVLCMGYAFLKGKEMADEAIGQRRGDGPVGKDILR